MSLSDTDRLEAIRTAIDTILSGGVTTYMIDGRSATTLDLKALSDMESFMISRINRQAGGSFGVVEFGRPR